MTTTEAETTLGGPRDITDEEAANFRRNGWARLDGLVTRDTAGALLDRLQAHMGADATASPLEGYRAKTPRPQSAQAMFNNLEDPSLRDDVLLDFSRSREMARAAVKLAGGPVRAWADEALVKMPAAAAGGRTPWHQDFPYMPFDRTGLFNIWIPLVEVPPEKGSMRFVTGSHRLGPLGRVIHLEGVDTLSLHPWIEKEYELSPPLHLQVGDATVHDAATIHFAPENRTDSPRWVYVVSFLPADTLYTGAPQRRTDDLGLVVNQPLEHTKFPVLQT
jgi:hypothetical protein